MTLSVISDKLGNEKHFLPYFNIKNLYHLILAYQGLSNLKLVLDHFAGKP